MSLDDALRSTTIDESRSAFVIPAGFSQGLATFGGLVIGALVRAMQARVPEVERTLRTLSVELIGAPAVGEATIRVRVLRRSGMITTIAAELVQGDIVQTHAVAVFAAKRGVGNISAPGATQDVIAEHAANAARARFPIGAPAWTDLAPMVRTDFFVPEFTKHFVFRPVHGIAFSGSAPETLGYISAKVPCLLRDAAWIAALADAWWLAVFVGMSVPRPAATLTFALNIHESLDEIDADVPLLHRGQVLASREGYVTELRELWDSRGRLVATNHQTVAVIK